MPYKFGALLYPSILLAVVVGQSRTPAARFAKAGAFSPETSRRPSSLGVTGLGLIEHAVKTGVLVPVGDGRFYVDRARHRRRQTVTLTSLAVILLMPFALAGWVLFTRGLL